MLAAPVKTKAKRKRGFFYEITHNFLLYVLILPAILYTVLFKYLPMVGVVIAFENFNVLKGMFKSPFVGFDNFKFFFRGSQWLQITFNTLYLNILFIVTGTVAAIALAIILTELGRNAFVKISQSVMIFPNFISWAVVALFAQAFLASNGGFINQIITAFGGEQISFYTSPDAWPSIFVIVRLWKGTGFGAIVYMAAIMGIDTEIYEAAKIDGANRLQRIFRITIPCLRDTVILLTLLSVGSIFYGDFGLIYTFVGDNSKLFATTDVIDTYVFRSLRTSGSFGMTAAVGLYQSLIGFILVMGTNTIVKKMNPDAAIF